MVQPSTPAGGYIVLTGATGLLGRYLLRDFLMRGHRVAVVARGNEKQSAQERIEQIMQMWENEEGKPLPRPVCMTGDITQPLCDLSEDDQAWLREHGHCMLHCAASLTFHAYKGEPQRTNVEGTNNVLELCQKTNLTEMHYISTAYVCGRRDELVMEDDLDKGQEFRNDYEESKFVAEQAVRDAGFDSLTVYRPVVITGDSKTGYTSTYHGTYLYMKMARMLAQNTDPDENGMHHIPVRWGLTGDERRNITPVDWNSEIIVQLYENSAAHGHTFHLAPVDPITMAEAIGFGTQFYKITGIEFLGFKDKPPHELNEMERWIWANISIYGSYDFMDPQFDMTNLHKFASDPPSPKIDGALSKRLLEYAEEDKWGRRKPPAVTAPQLSVAEFLSQRSRSDKAPSNNDGNESPVIGLDVLGNGGGQWTLRFSQGQLASIAVGLPTDRSLPILNVTIDQFLKWQDGESEPANSIQECLVESSDDQLSQQIAEALFAVNA